ncbi:MAG: hypothetical protein DWI58_19550 [Chloroflexi bacterium]|nr:MAG: hypothetical protein DWI58_19550 [Chloroflexota bacterium]
MEIGPPLVDVLARLPWFRDLSRDHRAKMLEDVAARLAIESSREEFTEVLIEWSRVAHHDTKWARLELLRNSGLLHPPQH